MITKEMTLADVVKEYPGTIPYLNEYRLDYCCGGHDPIEKIAKEKNIDLLPLSELEKETGYIRGGRSPVGMKKLFKTFFDKEVEKFDKTMVSAGR